MIHVIHYAAGKAPNNAEVHIGSRGSYGVSAAATMADGKDGGFESSLMVDADRQQLAQDRTGFDRAHALYRARGEVGGGTLGLDIDSSVVNQDPGSPHPREGSDARSLRFPMDANVNPSDAKAR